jgi:hypothetical protein
MDGMNTKCHIVDVNGVLTANIYGENNTLIAIQDLDSRAVIETAGEDGPVLTDNEDFGKPFESEEHLKSWLLQCREGETIEFVDEVPGTDEEDEVTPVEA